MFVTRFELDSFVGSDHVDFARKKFQLLCGTNRLVIGNKNRHVPSEETVLSFLAQLHVYLWWWNVYVYVWCLYMCAYLSCTLERKFHRRTVVSLVARQMRK